MKKTVLFLFYILFSIFKSAADNQESLYKVDPFWGSSVGNVVPGASVPWGMVKLSPDVDLTNMPTSGYRDGADIRGFSHNHAHGVGGAPRYGNILIIPQLDSVDIEGYRKYEKINEYASPGYYAANLRHKNHDIRAELTAAAKAGFHRYTFDKRYDKTGAIKPYVILDASHADKRIKNGLPQTYCTAGTVTAEDSVTVEGWASFTGGWGGENPYTVYFCLQFDTPAKKLNVFVNGKIYSTDSITYKANAERDGRFGVIAEFPDNTEEVGCKIGISYKNIKKARENLFEREHLSFDEQKKENEGIWVNYLSRVKLKGGNPVTQKNFYSALRNSMMMPVNVSEETDGWNNEHFWDFYCIWDTYRTVSPLYTLLYPEEQRKMIRCLLEIYEKKGYLPDAWIAGDYATVQGGSNSDVVLADAVVKNLGGFDYNKALEATLKNAEVQSDNPYIKGRFADEYNKLGYLRKETIKNSVSRTLEYAYNDFCIAEIARTLGDYVTYDKMGRRSMNVFSLFNPEYNLFCGKDSLGKWDKDFSPLNLRADSWNDPYFYEGSSRIYSTYTPQDMAGLISRFGGKAEFKKYLDSLFSKGDLIMENEFEFLVPYLYNFTGDHSSTAEKVKWLTTHKYLPGRNGIPGQDDAGALSAWYAFSTLGFMPVAGQDLYLIGTPHFDEAEIELENGRILKIKANNLSEQNIYISQARLNGTPLNRSWFKHSEIKDGGEIEFEMTDVPTNWGWENLPPSLSESLRPYALTRSEAEAKAGELVGQMTDVEKFSMIGGHNNFFMNGIERLGMHPLYMSDATAGVHIRKELDSNLEKSVAFPAPVALAATWEPQLAYKMSKAIGEECRAGNISFLLGPGLNIYRISQNGRNFEYFGEDPYLVSRMTENYVMGMQSTGTMATLKHFVCNNNEHHRRLSNSIVSDRTLHEIYLPAFKAGIDAGVASVMTSYNMVNGEYTAESKALVTNLLRDRLGFQGLVMSDWRSVYNPVKAICSGLDLEMPGDYADWLKALGETPFTHLKHAAPALVKAGDVEMRDIERMVKSSIATALMFGAYDTASSSIPLTKEDYERHVATALDVAREGIVLLKNRDAILPLSPEKVADKKILLSGMLLDTIPAGGGSALVEGFDNITIRQALERRFGKSLNVKAIPSDKDLKKADYVIICVGTADREGIDRPFALADSLENLVKRSARLNPNTIVIVNSGGGVRMTDWEADCGAILYTWFPGQIGNEALSEIIAGETNPSGKLPFTIEKEFSDTPGHAYKPEEEAFEMPWQDEYSFRFPINDIHYDEGVFVGYRWFEAKNISPLFPFGYGLSYTDFNFTDLEMPEKFEGDLLRLCFKVENTGSNAGKEVAQLYIGKQDAIVERPVKELKNFRKICLNPGERGTVEFIITPQNLAYFDEDSNDWEIEKGIYKVYIGNSSNNISLHGQFVLE